MLPSGTQLGRYEIAAPLGAGGMGEVYRATDSRLDRQVAIKVLPPQFVQDQARLARFEREAKAVASLSHPNILGIHDFGTEQGQTFAVMELLEGETLRRRIDDGAIPWRKAVDVALAIADGLAAAHAKGIIHRDLKPDNIFLTADERVKVLDFGLARIEPPASSSGDSPTGTFHPAQTEAGVILGTVGYMAPEQVRGRDVDARSDIFSLGCVLYEMVTGGRAFARQSAVETMAAILHDEPPEMTDSVINIPLELDRVIRHCLEKNREGRFQSARDLAFALKAMLSDSNVSGARMLVPSARGRPLAFWIVGACVLASIATASALLLPRLRDGATATPAGKTEQLFDSLAILPLVNVTDDPKGEPLCEGLAEHLSGRLSQVGQLKVRPITSTAHYRGQKADAKTVGRELDVQAVITGRLRQEDQTLIISLELVNARDNSLVWSNPYKGNRQQILDLQDQMARDLAGKLGLQLTGKEQQRLTKRDTEDPEAYLLYSEGHYHWTKFSEERLKMAMEYFRRAIEKDPKYARAYAGLGRSHLLLGTIHRGPLETFAEARKYHAQALAIDDTLADAHYGLGLIHLFGDWNWPEAEREFKRAIAVDPNFASQQVYGFYLAAMGKPNDALQYFQRDIELAPGVAQKCYELAMCYNWMRQHDQAIAEAKKAVDLDSNFFLAYGELALAYNQKGMHDEALAELRKVPSFAQQHPRILGLLGFTHAMAGQRAEAQQVLAELKDQSKFRFGCASAITMIHAALGDKDQAFEWLQKACDERHPHVVWLKVDPTMDNLRSDRRFDAFLQKMRLADKSVNQEGIQSVAVLPLENLSDDPKTEFLSDGLADQIINSLLQVRRQDLKVRPFSSVARYKLQKPDLRTIARDLNVQAIVTGSLRQQGDDLSIGIEIVDAREDNILWSKRYQGQLGGILDLQDQIARDVAANLRLRLTGEEEQRLTKRYTSDSETYLLYREGVYHINKFTPEALTTATEYFERALQKDSNYATALAGKARCQILLGTIHQGPRTTHPEARKLLLRALEIDNSLADARAGLGTIHLFHDWDWPAAERELKRAIADSGWLSHNIYGFWLAAHDRLPEALASTQRGQELDPAAAPRRHELSQCYIWMRRYDDAIAEARKAVELDSKFMLAYGDLGQAYALKGMHKEAIAEMQKAPDAVKGHPNFLGPLGYVYAKAGQRDEAQKVLDELKDPAKLRFGCAFAIARLHAALGERDAAFEWLHKACDERAPFVIWLKVDPTWDNLRSDDRFDDLLQKMGLAAKPTLTRRASEGLPLQARSASDGPDQPLNTLAVLPFDNQSPDPEAGYLGDDITYSLTDSLMRVRELIVRPYGSAARYKPGTFDAKTAGRELQVQAVLRGSIQKRGEDVIIEVELMHVGEDRRLWGKRYPPARLADRLALHQQIIQELPEQLRLSLTGQEKQVLARLPTRSLKAYELYIQGRLEWNKNSRLGLEKSFELFRQATELDANYAMAWAGLAEAYYAFPLNTESPPHAFIPKAKAAALRALQIDDQLAEAHTALALIVGAYDWDWSEAETRFQHALALNPNSAWTHLRYSQHLRSLGRLDEALVHSKRAQELDPLSLVTRTVTGKHYYFARQYDAAIEQYHKALDIDPNAWIAQLYLGQTYAQQGQFEEAIAKLKSVRQLSDDMLEPLASLGQVYAVMGRAAEARQVLEELTALSKQRIVPPYYFAIIHAALGEKDQAFVWLNKACDDRYRLIAYLKVDPLFDSLRDDPRFQKIIADMKFPQ